MLKKQLIMEKALELFSEQGFESTSVQQITERCGISKGAFYLSFKTKDELVFSMVDYYLQQFISDIDRVVRASFSKEILLEEFYKCIFQTIKKHSKSARVFFNEKIFVTKKELFQKVNTYEANMTKLIVYMLEAIYGDSLQNRKYDVMYCVKGFMKSYAEIFIFSDIPLNLDQLSKSLAEKTDVIARQTTIPFITEELALIITKPCTGQISKETLLYLMDKKLDIVEDNIAHESLELLKEQIEHLTYSKAILKGLIENIRLHPESQSMAYVLDTYFELNNMDE